MFLQVGSRRVTTPDGVEWRVGRRWVAGRGASPLRRGGDGDGRSILDTGFDMPFDGFDLGDGLLVSLIVLAIVVILIPILFFGAELIIVGVVVAVGILTRVFGLKPWVVEAKVIAPPGSTRQVEWQVRGWRKSRLLIGEVATDLTEGRELSDRRLA